MAVVGTWLRLHLVCKLLLGRGLCAHTGILSQSVAAEPNGWSPRGVHAAVPQFPCPV